MMISTLYNIIIMFNPLFNEQKTNTENRTRVFKGGILISYCVLLSEHNTHYLCRNFLLCKPLLIIFLNFTHLYCVVLTHLCCIMQHKLVSLFDVSYLIQTKIMHTNGVAKDVITAQVQTNNCF